MKRISRYFVFPLVAGLLITLSGCNPDSKAGGVAIVDLDQVASAIGRDKLITSRVQQFAKQQETNLNKLKDELNKNIAEEQDKLGKKPKKKDQERVNKLRLDSEVKLRQEIQKVSQVADQLKINLVMDFRREVEPVARRVAQKHKFAAVMIKNNSLLYIDPAADITDSVIDELQAAASPAPATTSTNSPASDSK